MFYSKTSSTAFACPAIGESHVSTSVGEAETYAVGNAAKSIMSLQYMSEEMGLQFPQRIICQVDSNTAKSFSDNSCKKSKLKHIDCRQEWVQVLRDKNILKCVHVPGTENLADLFTKILDPGDFIRQRNTIMVECPHVIQPYADMARVKTQVISLRMIMSLVHWSIQHSRVTMLQKCSVMRRTILSVSLQL